MGLPGLWAGLQGRGRSRPRWGGALWQALTCGFEQTLEELLVVDSGHAADLGNLRLLHRPPVHEVGCDPDGQFATHFSDSEA